MTPLAAVVMGVSWSLVLGLTAWSFRRVLRASRDREREPLHVPDSSTLST